MFVVREIDNTLELYHYFKQIAAPYYFPVSYEEWEKSFFHDIDNLGKKLFSELYTQGAYEDGVLVGFVQYGLSSFGFDEHGEISEDVSYQIIRNLYYDRNHPDAGKALLEEAVHHFDSQERIYAFFHYFGMSCYARHGKLFERYDYIKDLLEKQGFVIEHENVYYSMDEISCNEKEIEVKWSEPTLGSTRCAEFLLNHEWIGECEVHFISAERIAYLRWIYIDEKKQNQKLGSRSMKALLYDISNAGYKKLDTDTAMTNEIAQHYYEKNGFKREGVTRSFFKETTN